MAGGAGPTLPAVTPPEIPRAPLGSTCSSGAGRSSSGCSRLPAFRRHRGATRVVTRESPGADCVFLAFRERYALPPAGQVALEDYARALLRAQGAEAVPAAEDASLVAGLHLCGPAVPPRGGAAEDIEAFAREMTARGGERLGWS